MEQTPVMDINIQVRKTHIILLTALILGATATATVDIKDQTNIFQTLNMKENPIQNLQNPSNPQDAATKNYVDNQAGFSITGTYDVERGDADDAEYQEDEYSSANASVSVTASCQDSDAYIIAQDKGTHSDTDWGSDNPPLISDRSIGGLELDWESRPQKSSLTAKDSAFVEYYERRVWAIAVARAKIICAK